MSCIWQYSVFNEVRLDLKVRLIVSVLNVKGMIK